jgi:hypothetical protein
MEERKRTWWAVVIIDRYHGPLILNMYKLTRMHRVVSIGGKGRFLACEDPGVQTHLPVDVAAWVS